MTPDQKAQLQGWFDFAQTQHLVKHIQAKRQAAIDRAIGARFDQDDNKMRMELETVCRYDALLDDIKNGTFLPKT